MHVPSVWQGADGLIAYALHNFVHLLGGVCMLSL
jgi:hypothetical protein